jgi:hypothetical protein
MPLFLQYITIVLVTFENTHGADFISNGRQLYW